jgi:RNA polymerase sigma factor (sigma-70 family)
MEAIRPGISGPVMNPPDEEPRSEGPSPGEELERKDLEGRVWRAVDQLNPRNQKMWRLKWLEGWTLSEIARHFGLAVGTVKTMMHRDRQRLRLSLSPISS